MFPSSAEDDSNIALHFYFTTSGRRRSNHWPLHVLPAVEISEPEMAKKTRAPSPPNRGASRSSILKKTQGFPPRTQRFSNCVRAPDCCLSSNHRSVRTRDGREDSTPHPPKEWTSGLETNEKMQPGDPQAAVTSRPERSDELQRPDPLIGYRSIWETSEQKSRPAEHMPPTLLGDIAQNHSIALIWSQFYTR